MKPFSLSGALTAVALCLALPGIAPAQQATQPGVADQESAAGTNRNENVQAIPQAGENPSAAPGKVEAAPMADANATIDGVAVVGRSLYGAEDEAFGEIRTVIVTAGAVDGVVVDVGQFLGLGERLVIIPADRVSVQGDRVVARELSRADLEAMPAYDGPPLQPGGGAASKGGNGG